MAQWYVKELSKLTHVSVQTLHHYDHIGLLKPSVRLANGYRLYSEKDLLKLQQIIALKFFGFPLSQIKTLLLKEVDMIDHFRVQSRFLEEKAKILFDANQTLKNIIADCNDNNSLQWETIIQLIEVYRMTQQLEKTWVGKALNSEELKKYARFQQELKTRFTDSEKKAFEQEWTNLVIEINANLDQDPTSAIGIDIGKRCMNWVNHLSGKKHVSLRKAVWEKGFKGGHGSDEHGLSAKSVEWLDEAISAYYTNRISSILTKIATHPHDVVLNLWEELLVDMYGDEQAPKNEMVDTIMNDIKTSQVVKKWLEKYIQQVK